MCISAFEGEGRSESAAMNAAVRAVEGIFFLLGFETSWYRVSQVSERYGKNVGEEESKEWNEGVEKEK